MKGNREKQIINISILGIIANLILAGVKIIIGVMSGSIAITSDAVNNLTDSSTALITIIGTKLAQKKPDKNHPFGFGRVEYLTSMIIGIKLNSGALIASGKEAKNDVLISVVTIISALVYMFTKLSIDSYAGLFISIFILKTGFEVLKDTINKILGEKIDSEVKDKIFEIIQSSESILGVHDLILNLEFMASTIHQKSLKKYGAF